MESLEGVLMVPPDRGQILGRAVWKSRYVVVGRRGAREHLHPSSQSQRPQPGRSVSQNSKFRGSVQAGEYAVSIYKSEDDQEPSQQYPVNCISDCQVQLISHRKQGPVLPTLVIIISDKEKKRRSSRAAGLISTKESTATTLWFRTPPDDHHCSLHEWRQFILSRRPPMSPESLDSPASPTFTNPFSSTRSKDERILSAYKAAYSRDRDASISHNSQSPSLRSKRSDVSSPTSAHPPNMPHRSVPAQNYTTMLPGDIPADLPSPAESGSDEQARGDASGSSAQARSVSVSSPHSTLDRPDRRHASISTNSAAMRETILDRAFQMRCIPGSERAVPGEEKLSSLARFDALMRETEEKRRKREAEERADQEARRRQMTTWREDSSSEEVDSGSDEEESEDEEDDEYYYEQGPVRSRRQTLIPPATQRALEFITGRNERPESPRTPRRATLEHGPDAFPMPPSNPIYRPQTSYAFKRPHMSARTQSQPHLPHAPPRGPPPPLPSQVAEDEDERLGPQGAANPKRVSFTEYTKRGSSTSSLLLVQNGSGASSSRASAELEYHPVLSPLPRGSSSRGARQDEDARCGWRGSVGVVGGEGNFI